MKEQPDIAIVGRACRLPGAPSVDRLWTLLASGECAVSRIPADRWSLERMYHPRGAERGRSYTWAAGILPDVWGFDPAAFGLSPREAEQMDPQQRLLLELSWEAFEDAGMPPSLLAGSEAGVFVGASAVDHANLRLLDIASADAYMMTGNTLSIVSNRLSYIYDLHGPSFTIDTACSSALVALNEAVASLRSGRVDTAIVAGVNLLLSPHSFIGFSQATMLSKRGLCQAFSAQADGYVRAEGGVVLVLQTRAAAERAGRHVHAFIEASDVNSDGRTNGISLPSKTFQARLLTKLYTDRKVDLERLAFIEAHGTGTPVGDPIEAAAIGEVLAKPRRTPLLIGSIKTNIGHMEAASGLGGVLKAMLALEHDALPASLHSETLTPHIDFADLNLEVARELTPLAPRDGDPRLAGVNSFGFGGTNAHVVLADGTAPRRIVAPASAPGYLVLSAHSRGALSALASDYALRLRDAESTDAEVLAAATGQRRDRLPQRLVVPMREPGAMADILERLCDEDQEVVEAARGTAVARAAPVAFVFSGNGSQFAGMGLAAYERSAIFHERLDAISDEFAEIAGWSIVETLRASDLAAKLELTQISQPLLFALQSATVFALRAAGLQPSFTLGHSVGEVAAAEAAGILDTSNALRTIFARSLHQELTNGHGGMAVIIAGIDVVRQILRDLPDVEIAAHNSPRAFTVSGPIEDIARLSDLARQHQARIRKLDLAYPFHSALMGPVRRPLLRSLADLEQHAPAIPFLSTVTGKLWEDGAPKADYWWRNVREPVRFSEAVTAAVAAGARIFVEIGPSATLLTHVNDTIDERVTRIATLGALDKRDKGCDPIKLAVATALTRGATVDATRVFGEIDPAARVALPHYPWQRKTYQSAETSEASALIRAGAWHPLIGARYGSDRLEWHSALDTTLYPSLADHCVDGRAILPGAAFAEMALAVARDWLGTEQATVADLEISSPMQLSPDTAREVVCRLSPLGNQLEIASRPRLGQTPWQMHATAKILRDPTVGALPEPEDHAPLSPSHPVTGAEIYAMADRAGLQYGPTFRKLATAAAVRPGRIALELTDEPADPAFGIDPARLDSCFHALVLIFSSLRDAVHGTAYVPVRFGEIMLRKPGCTFQKARIDVLRRDERIILANFLLMDGNGEIVVFIREARFQAIRTSRSADVVKQMIYRTSVLASEPTASRQQRGDMSLQVIRRAVPTESVQMTEDFVLLEGWATSLALETARSLATANFIDVEALVSTGRLPARIKPWLEDMLVALDRSGLCHKDRLGRHIDPDIELPAPDEILRTIVSEHQNLSAELLVAASAITAIDAILANAGDALKRPLSAKVLDGLELGSSQAQGFSAYVVDLLRRSVPAWPADRAMRVLQIGFGPLSTLCAQFAELHQARLTILDPDRRRLERARMTLANGGDIGCVEKIEDLAGSTFDFVIAADALYRYRRLPGFWAGVRRAMARGALLVAVEPQPSFFRSLVLGLDACLADGERGYDGQSVSEADWLDTLLAIGLSDPKVAPVATEAGTGLLLTAEADGERAVLEGTGTALLVGIGDAMEEARPTAIATLLASSGLHVSIVPEGEPVGVPAGEAPAFVMVLALGHDGATPAKSLLDACLHLRQIVTDLGQQPTTVWLVTSGAIYASGEPSGDVANGLWAFARTLANETPHIDLRRVDVAPDVPTEVLAPRLRDLVLAGGYETEILIASSGTRVVRFVTGSAHDRGRGGRVEAARLKRGDGAGFDRIHWDAAPRQAPGPNDVEIGVGAVGLNFRDVMFGLGLLPEEILENGFAGPTLGLECAGRVERVGTAVRNLKPGDRVMAFAKNAFATHVTTPAAVVAPIPNELSFETAATVPVAFLTAYHALMICARLKAEEWVLIHGGAGGVGLAAIQIARWRGARVIATAGSPERRALLRALGAEHAFDSRSNAFAEDVRAVTGDGVGVVVNSLSGEAMERSIAVLRPFGRFVELGKRDYVANTHIGLRPFRRNLSYFGVDLDQLLIEDPATSKLLMRSVTRLFASGELTPLPYRAFDAVETVEAFRVMQQAGHVGKLVVRPPKLSEITLRQRRSFPIAADKIHLVTGGFGGFGLETARWLAERGARNLMLIGRSGAATDTAREAIAALAAQGVRVRAEALDITDKDALETLFARFGRDLPPLAGVIHAAMVLDDAMVANLDAERMERVLRPKVTGADLLDRLTREMRLDYFVLYSSATTLIGNPGQAAYVAANGYLEGLARRRRKAGLPALAIAWGAIEDVGVLARSDETREALASRVGIKGMAAQDALRAMADVLALPSHVPDDAVVAIAPINWSAARQHLAVLKAPAYRKLMSLGEAVASDKEKVDIAALVVKSSPEEARKTISGLIVEEIARVLRLPREDVAKTTPLSEIGLDSLMAVELAMGLEERFVLNAPLSTTASSFTVNELADHVIGLATGTLSDDQALEKSMAERHLGAGAVERYADKADLVREKAQAMKGILA